jgi:hypothetical protein
VTITGLLRFLLLVVVLNVIRYLVGGLIESFLVLPYLFDEMARYSEYFNTEFSTLDWVTSYLYNFVMWLVIVWFFHLLRKSMKGSDLIISLKVFALAWLWFASVSAIYMNHYSHPGGFYVYNIADAFIAFLVVAVANGLLYRKLMASSALPVEISH